MSERFSPDLSQAFRSEHTPPTDFDKEVYILTKFQQIDSGVKTWATGDFEPEKSHTYALFHGGKRMAVVREFEGLYVTEIFDELGDTLARHETNDLIDGVRFAESKTGLLD